MNSSRAPSATYRLQFNKDFRFEDARRILDYLRALGISDLYASPILASRRGSGHGYDVIDPTRIDPELGTEEDFAALQADVQQRGMRILFDIVPNHMAAGPETPWWMDVLEYGPDSPFASYFDVNWHPASRSLDGKVLLPILDRPFGEVLDSGGLRLEFDHGKFVLSNGDVRFPVAPRSYASILNHRIDSLKTYLDPSSGAYQEYSGIVAALGALLDPARQAGTSASDKRLGFNGIHERLGNLAESSTEIARFIADNLREFNGSAGKPESFVRLEQLLAEQHYKLAYWQNANDAINYRRFFTITDLVGIRVEDPLVFEATHGPFFKLVRKETFAGLRVDHIDGLRDPYAYLNRLRDRAAEVLNGSSSGAPYVVVEKILAPGEQLPADWAVAGTTGYDYLNAANWLFVDAERLQRIQAIYERFIGRSRSFDNVLYGDKKMVMGSLLAPEMRALSRRLAELASDDRYARELPRQALTNALIEVTASLPVYRTYIRSLEVPPEAAEIIEGAVAAARERRSDLSDSLLFLRDVLLVLGPAHVTPGQREARLAFVMRWQQFTGSIVAKSMEDTALYVYYPLASLNEVGSDPRPEAAYAPRDFVEFLNARREHWPASLNATTTHDTKRSEDVRARINVLSQMPEQWEAALERWASLNAPLKSSVDGQPVPDRNEEYLLYQTLLGIWPDSGGLEQSSVLDRLQSYAVKAIREAMVHTRWTRPNAAHEEGLSRFIDAILTSATAEKFRTDACAFRRRMAYAGMVNGLAQTLLKMVCPGVPDFYQGAELWDLRLVDPDNRGPVDFAARMEMLQQLIEEERLGRQLIPDLREHWQDGRIKLYVIWKTLAYRRLHPALFAEGGFSRLRIENESRSMAFCRHLPDHEDACLLIAPRWVLPEDESDGKPEAAVLEPGMPATLKNIFTGKTHTAEDSGDRKVLALDQVCGEFPVALLAPQDALA